MPGIGDREPKERGTLSPEERQRLGRDAFLSPGARTAALVLLMAIVAVAVVATIRVLFGSSG